MRHRGGTGAGRAINRCSAATLTCCGNGLFSNRPGGPSSQGAGETVLFNRVCAVGFSGLGLALVMGACGGGDSAVQLPSTATARPAPPALSSSAEQAVRSAYASFWDASDRALTAPPEQVRLILRDYSTGGYLDFQVRQIVLQQGEHRGPWGKVVPHVRAVDVAGSKATVRDCQDASNAGLADTRTNKLIPGTRGPKQRNLRAQLVQGGDGRWRVSDLKQFPQSC